jgi:hypothetical protein
MACWQLYRFGYADIRYSYVITVSFPEPCHLQSDDGNIERLCCQIDREINGKWQDTDANNNTRNGTMDTAHYDNYGRTDRTQ